MMAGKAKVPVLLLKTKSSPSDGYEDHFIASQRYTPIFVPVLEHRFSEASLSKIASIIENSGFATGSAEAQYGGIIFTSQRAIEAFKRVTVALESRGIGLRSLIPAEVPLYVVGPATARGLRSMELGCPILGEDTGNGDALAAYILRDYNARHARVSRPKLPLLFLVGEQRRDIIPRTLQAETLPQEERITIEEMVVYETGEMASFPSDFKKAMEGAEELNPARQWIVIFSPTGCKAVLEQLDLSAAGDEEAVLGKDLSPRKRTTLVATIGPTTKAYLQRELGFEPDACASQPSPEGLIAALEHVS